MGRTDWDRRITAVLSPGAMYFHCDEILREEFYTSAWSKSPEKNKTFVSTIRQISTKG